MKHSAPFFICVFTLSNFIFSESRLAERYHTYEEIQTQLAAWDSAYGNNPNPSTAYPGSGIIYHLEEIGRSSEEDLPFWGVRLSYNANIEEDEPRFLFLGQCHAEEIYGIEITMELIRRFLNPSNLAQNMRAILVSSEIWVIPTYNPEGLTVVHGFESGGEWIQDISFRKNKRDVNLNGLFDFLTGVGNDSDGVDLNRNYDFNWIFGDGKWVEDQGSGSYQAHFDYYRGDAPFSESETQALRDFALEKKFLLSIAYHSSRSGNVSEEVIYPWLWEDGKYSPDYPVISTIANEIATLIPKEIGVGSYLPVAGSSRKGNAHDWFYTETGCIQFLIETGTENIQPDNIDLIEDTIERNLRGAFYLMNRGIGYGIGEFGADAYQVEGVITDLSTGSPVNAVVTISELNGPMLKPRYTNEQGRYRRLLTQGTFTLNASAFGYENQSISITPSSTSILEQNIQLNPLPNYHLTLNLSLPDSLVTALQIIISGSFKSDTIHTNGEMIELEYPEDQYYITLTGDNLFPQFFDISLDSDTYRNIELKWANTILDETFTNLDNWEVENGNWTIDNGFLISQTDLTYPNTPISITSIPINVSEYNNLAFSIDFQYELEWENDKAYIASICENDTSIVQWNNQNWIPHHEYHPIFVSADSFRIQIGISPDNTVQYRGLKINHLTILGEKKNVMIVDNMMGVPSDLSLFQPYPNPFNSVSIINYSLPKNSDVTLSVFDILGREVDQLWNGEQKAGYHQVAWRANSYSNGIYFIRMVTENFVYTQKLLLLK